MTAILQGTWRRGGSTLVLLCLLAGLSSCADALLPGQGEPPRLFDLSPKSTFDEDLPSVRWQLVVEAPEAAQSLNNNRIALKRSAMNLEYYANTAWTDVAPQMVQTLIIESFENTGKIIAVGRESASLRSDYLLKTELREFQSQYNGSGAPVVNVRINAKMVKMPQRTIIAGENFGAEITAAGDNVDDVVAAFDDALGKTLKSLVNWTMKTPAQARRKRQK